MRPFRLELTLAAEHGASLVSVLATLVAVAALAALAMPALTSSSHNAQTAQIATAEPKAQDAGAETLAETAQTAMATYQASSGNGYAGATVAALSSIEPTLITASATQPYLAGVSATSDTYTVVATDPLTGNRFSLTDNAGQVVRTCTTAGRGDCGTSGTW